jgi:HSP20 family molecular chaperone IbpA
MNSQCTNPVNVNETRKTEAVFRPDTDMRETPNGWVFEIDLPGVRREDLSLEVNDGVLALRAEARTGGEGRRIHAEFDPVVYERHIRVGDEVDVAGIRADLARGVLTVELPRAEAKKPRKIEVKIGG